MGKLSFAAQVESVIRGRKPRQPVSIVNNILNGCYVIMRRLHSYRLEHFMADDFKTAHYFLLVDLVNKDLKNEEKAYKNAAKKNKK